MDLEPANQALVDSLARIAGGDAAALSSLYRQTSPQLFALLNRILRRADLAEEALQEVFISVWRKAHSYHAQRGPAMGWLIGIARYRAIDLQRRHRLEVPLDDAVLETSAAPESSPMNQALLGLDRQRLEDCMTRLSADQQRGIRLAFFRGLTREEIAAQLTAPLGTVKSWIRRGLQALKECLSR